MKRLKNSQTFNLHSELSRLEVRDRIQALEEKGNFLRLARTEVKIVQKEELYFVSIKRRLGRNLSIHLSAKVTANESGSTITGDARVSDMTLGVVIIFGCFLVFAGLFILLLAVVEQNPKILLSLFFFGIFALVVYSVHSRATSEIPTLLNEVEAALK